MGEFGQSGGDALAVPDTLLSRIASIWSEVLGLETVGGDADFFELGGDSLAAVRMLFAIEEQTSLQVSFTDFLEAPTIDALASALAEAQATAPQQEAAKAGEAAEAGDDRAPLSFAQERLWFLEQLGGSTAAYNMPIGVRLRGALEVEAMQGALQEVVCRHQALRTRFASEGRDVFAVAAPVAKLQLEQVDLRGEPDPEGEAQRILAALASRGFDLGSAPLARACLARLADEEWVLELVFHHIVCDGWSHAVIMRELSALYDAQRTGNPVGLAQPRMQYAQFARRERAALAQGMDELVAPWIERLSGAPQALELPTDRPRPAVPSHAGLTHRVRLAPATAAAVRRFAMERKATPFATLLAAFYVLLYRHSGQEDIVVGATTAARGRSDLQDGVGLFAGTVALRGDLAGAPSFHELVGRVRDTVLWAIAHERAPLQEIVARLDLERDLSRHPLFQVFCAQVPLARFALDRAEPYDVCPTTSRFDLTLFIEEEQGEQLELAWEYSTDLFDAATIARLSRRYVRLLERAIEQPQRSIAELPLLDAEEREQAICAGRERGREHLVWCIHDAFERCAAATPDAIAVSFEGQSLTYGQLNARANRLAHRLIALGVGAETIVALLFEPSPEMIVAILGVLKAGGAYLPLDPEHPSERLEMLLADACPHAVVTKQPLLERLGEPQAAVVCLDRDAAQLEQLSSEDPPARATPENLAYVIYTSGSTGRPKGVQVEHRQVARLFEATDQWFGFESNDVWALLHSYAFDFSVWELWGALAYGGQLVLAPVWTTRSPEALVALLAGRGVTVLNVTPGLFAAIQEELLRNAVELSLRFVIFGGEALHPPTLRPWFAQFGDSGPVLVNMYGITETTVHVTYRPLTSADCERDLSPVGVPIEDLSVYLLDGGGAPVPSGVPGELYVGGAGVARGYLNRPQLTAERFVENPFGPGRLYRTGDVGVRLPDGQLEFRGRADDQVKVRGFRIELGEIESAIREHPGVSDCAAVAIEAAQGDTRLAAYVVASGSGEADGETVPAALREELTAHLQQRLPSYMVPAAFTVLERIPLTRNGKVDRRSLPAPSWEREQQEASALVVPQTPAEITVAEIWREVLAVEQVGAEDNFFNLGGHSLLAARVITQVRKRCEVEISVRALFEQPILREFAAVVEAATPAGQAAPDGRAASSGQAAAAAPVGEAALDGRAASSGQAAAAAPVGEAALDGRAAPAGQAEPAAPQPTSAYPLSFPQQQLLFFDQLAPGSITYNAALAWRVTGPLDAKALSDALNEVFERHEALRTVFVWGEHATPGQQVRKTWGSPLALVDLTRLAADEQEQELERLLVQHARRPFDLANDPMLRTTLFRLGEKQHVILLAPHHIAFDAWAVEVLYRELGELYAAKLEGRDPQLQRLDLQYRDFAAWQRRRLQGERVQGELDFWRSHLAGAPAFTRLPTDRPRPAEQTFEGATHRFTFDRQLADAVRRLCAATGVSPYVLLLTAFATLIYRSSGEDDILFGGPMANRELSGTEHLIGFFANTVVVRLRLDGNPTFAELLGRARDSMLASYEHQQTPLELVVDAVRPERDPGVHPLFQVNFRVRVGDSPRLQLSGARSQPVNVDLGLARFDLSLELHLLDERVEGELGYNIAIFDKQTIERLTDDLRSLLSTLTANPDTRLLAIKLASEEDGDESGRDGASAGRAGLPIRGFRRG